MKVINVFKMLRKAINNLKQIWKAINVFKARIDLEYNGFFVGPMPMGLRGC